eukprot:m.109274 g.109274  ORF g.109274 m.109274 type:complete len:441 (+) comp15242_c0_seq2:4667-5989(+)
MTDSHTEGDWTLHPFLSSDRPHSNVWYVVPTPKDDERDALGPRIGHVCCHCGDSIVVFFAGATPHGLTNDTHVLDLVGSSWRKVECNAEILPPPRYDHGGAYLPAHHSVYVFGGVNDDGNLNDMWKLSLDDITWKQVAATGDIPSSRVVHNLMAVADSLYLFGGGEAGYTAVDDTHVYQFSSATSEWKKHVCTGDIPSRRQGHAMCVVDQTIIIHGGMHDGTFFDDLYQLDTVTMHWTKLKQSQSRPVARSGHAMCALNRRILLTGGLTIHSAQPTALDDVHLFDLDSQTWTVINLQTQPVAARFDFSLIPFATRLLEKDAILSSEMARVKLSSQASPSAKKTTADTVVQDVTPLFGAVIEGQAQTVTTSSEPTTPDVQQEQQTKPSEPTTQAAPAVSRSELTLPRGECISTGEADAVIMYGGMDLLGNMHNDCLLLHIA